MVVVSSVMARQHVPACWADSSAPRNARPSGRWLVQTLRAVAWACRRASAASASSSMSVVLTRRRVSPAIRLVMLSWTLRSSC